MVYSVLVVQVRNLRDALIVRGKEAAGSPLAAYRSQEHDAVQDLLRERHIVRHDDQGAALHRQLRDANHLGLQLRVQGRSSARRRTGRPVSSARARVTTLLLTAEATPGRVGLIG